MNQNLIPTPVVDKNGKQTTVHKKNEAASQVSSSLSSARPSAIAAPKKKENPTAIDWMMTQMPQDEGFLWEMGTGLGKHNRGLGVDPHGGRYGIGGSRSMMTLSEVLGYMRHGATFYEAARLSQFDTLDEWEHDEAFQKASERCNTKFTKTADLVESKGLKTSEAFRLLGNGLTDELLDSSTLTEDQTLSVFSRFKYTHFTASKTSSETPAMIHALLDGTLPYAVFDGGYEKASITKLCKELYGNPGKKAELTEEERQEIKSNPDMILTLLDITDHHNKSKDESDIDGAYRDFAGAYRAVKKFGESAVREHHPKLLNATLSDGSVMGADGAATAKSFIQHLNETTSYSLKQYSAETLSAVDETPEYRTARFGARPDVARMSVDLAEIVDMTRAGMTYPAIVHCLMDMRMKPSEVLEQAKNDPAPLLMEGKL